ncbi:MAG: hypothetical protein NWE98_05125 [Candidatus Bathyarchaeota archaeon]|nr:hypothetical protein [Candidatus Bathyarchaeota archaeon]
MYDLSTHNETCLTTAPSEHPAISGNRIVYEQTIRFFYAPNYVPTTTHIYCVDLSTGQTIDVTQFGGFFQQYSYVNTYYGWVFFGPGGGPADGTAYSNPAISGNIIAYQRSYVGLRGVYMTNLTIIGKTQLSSSGASPAICENQPDIHYIVYQDNRDGNWDIYLYITAYSGTGGTPALFTVANNTASQENPAVSDGRIVYQDNRNGNWDIYLTTVGYIPQSASPPPYNNGLPKQAPPPKTKVIVLQTSSTPPFLFY